MTPNAPYAGVPGVNPFTGAPMIPGSDLSDDGYGGLATPTAFEAYEKQYRAEIPVSAFDGTLMDGADPDGCPPNYHWERRGSVAVCVPDVSGSHDYAEG